MTLDERIQRLEDINEIAKLKARYCDAADGGWDRRSHNADKVVELFIKDNPVWDIGVAGKADSIAGIHTLFAGFSPLWFAFHIVTAPLIEVNGDKGTGRWHLIALLNHKDDGPQVAGGVYDDNFQRTTDGWRFSAISCRIAFMNPMKKGWVDHLHQAGFHPSSLVGQSGPET